MEKCYLSKFVDGIRPVDHHCHNIQSLKGTANAHNFRSGFTEARDDRIINMHASNRSVRSLCSLLHISPSTEEKSLQEREKIGLESLCSLYFNAAKLDAIMIDDGFVPETVLPIEWHKDNLTGVIVKRILRIEHIAEQAIVKALNESYTEQGTVALNSPLSSITSFDHAFRTALTNEISSSDVVAFKSICAYRCGLDIPEKLEKVDP